MSRFTYLRLYAANNADAYEHFARQFVAPDSEVRFAAWLARINTYLRYANDDAEAYLLRQAIKNRTINGSIYVEVWRQDSSLETWVTVERIDATLTDLNNLRDRIECAAEGPYSLSLIHPRDLHKYYDDETTEEVTPS